MRKIEMRPIFISQTYFTNLKKESVMTMEEILLTGKFTEAQMELLRMFSRQYPDKLWVEVKDLLSKYFMEKASGEMDNFFEQQEWGDKKLQEWAMEHMRTPYHN